MDQDTLGMMFGGMLIVVGMSMSQSQQASNQKDMEMETLRGHQRPHREWATDIKYVPVNGVDLYLKKDGPQTFFHYGIF